MLLYGKCRLHSVVAVEVVTPNFSVDLICGRLKCAFVGCIFDVSKRLLIKIFVAMAKPDTKEEL
jgi:hypothetical protein